MTTATAAHLEAVWGERVRANRDQVDRVREVPDRDFYAPVSSLFVADPRRTGEEALDELITLAEPGDRWLDIGAGAGRYALPLALHVDEVIAVEPSASMRNALRTGKAEHGLDNIRIVAGEWPAYLSELGEPPVADVALVAHVGYDIEESARSSTGWSGPRPPVRRDADRSESGIGRGPVLADRPRDGRLLCRPCPIWRSCSGRAGARSKIRRVERAPRTFDSFDGLATFVRRQLWITDDGEKERRFRGALAEMARERDDDGWTLATPPVGAIGIFDLTPPGEDR